MIIAWFRKYQLLIMILAWLGSVGFASWKTYQIVKQSMEHKQLKETIKIVEKRNEIANNRPDDAAFFDSLLNDPNW